MNSEDTVKILICVHSNSTLPQNDIFLPVQAGAEISKKELQIPGYNLLKDDYGDNISLKNKSFCEMTVIYWAWKNIKNLFPNLKYIGLNHYRRFFAFDKKRSIVDLYEKKQLDINNYAINSKLIIDFLDKYDAIVPQKTYYPYSLEKFYELNHKKEDFNVMKSVVLELNPNYKDVLNDILVQGNTMHNYNMFLLKWDQFTSYCEWVFPILFEIEQRIDISHYDEIQSRVFGYMAERLFNVWLNYNNLHIKEVPIYKYTDNNRSSTLLRFASILQREASFYITKYL